MNRIVRVTMGSAVLIGGLFFAGSTAFGNSPRGGPVQVFGTPTNGGGGQVVLTGAVGDFGTASSVNAAGKPDSFGNYKLLTLSQGTILVKGQGGNNGPPTTFNARTCSATFVHTGTDPVVSGTGAYAGIDGSLKVTVSFALVLPLKNGKCDTSNSAVPLAQYGSIMGSGTLSQRMSCLPW